MEHLCSYFWSFSFEEPSRIFHSSSRAAERPLVWRWAVLVGALQRPRGAGQPPSFWASACVAQTLNHNGPNPIYLLQYQFNLGFIPPVSYCHVQLLQAFSRNGRIFPHLQMSLTNIFQNTNIHFCGYGGTTISFLNISCHNLEKWEQFLKSDYKISVFVFFFPIEMQRTLSDYFPFSTSLSTS